MFDTETFYNKNYEQTLSHLELQKNTITYNRDDIEKELNALYIYEGHDMEGRGELKEAQITSSIAAYQVFLSQNP